MNKVIFLVGPTAVGKTRTARYLAKCLNGEIISCDSMQVYKGMEILSSQPPASSRKKIPYHFIAVISPEKEYNVSKYRRDAVKKISQIIRKGKTPIFAGGTGLYMSILIDGIFEAKTENEAIRKRLYEEAQQSGSPLLHQRLKGVDPEAASKIHPNDLKRIIRALEVFESTGKPISHLQKQRHGLGEKYDIRIFCLNMERDKLYERISKRVDEMFKKGLLKEAQRLLKNNLSKTASCAIGIREIKGYFEGEYDLNEAKKRIVRNTCLYSKRQLTWFRKDKRINWIDVEETDTSKIISLKILAQIKA